MVLTCRCHDPKEKKTKIFFFFDEGKDASFPPEEWVLVGWWRASYKSNLVPRKTVSSPDALGSTSGNGAAVLDASCALPMDGQLDPKMPDVIVIFSFLLFAITLLSHGVQLVASFRRREDG